MGFQKYVDLFLCKKHTYLTLPPQRWHLSPVQPGLQIQFPLEVSQNPLDVHGFEHGNVGNGVVVATLISEGVCCILSISWSEDPITDRMRIKTKKVHSNQDFLSTMVFKLLSKVGGTTSLYNIYEFSLFFHMIILKLKDVCGYFENWSFKELKFQYFDNFCGRFEMNNIRCNFL